MKLNKTTVDKLPIPSDLPQLHRDSELRGFGVKVFPSGLKSFFVEKKVQGKTRRITLGRYGELTAEQARKEAVKLAGQIATGRDPIADKAQAKLEAKTLRQGFEDYLGRRILKPQTVFDIQRCMKEVYPDWLDKPMTRITPDLVLKRHRAYGAERSEARANLAMRYLRAIFNFALELDIRLRSALTAGILWVTFAFAGTLGLNRSMAMEKDRGCLDGLLLTPVDRSAIYFGKVIGNLIFMFIVEIVVLPVYSILYSQNLFNPGLLLVILLGSIGYTTVGTLLATMAVETRTRDVLLPILLFPLILPVLIAAVKASSGYLAAVPISEILPYINLLIVYDVIFAAISFMIFDYVVEE